MKFLFSLLVLIQVNVFAHPLLEGYNDNYLKYYTSQELHSYLEKLNGVLPNLNYQISQLGKSIEGKPLFVIHPRQFERGKKLIVLTCRQHGDEGTSNYILEGFLNSLARNTNPEWLNSFQIIIFPMLNPDGADKQTRYNSAGYDLNRTWDLQSRHNLEQPETRLAHQYINSIFTNFKTPVPIALDLHGSFGEDFMYLGDKNFVSPEYFQIQTHFVSMFGKYNPWQNGIYNISNGEQGMLRLLFAKVFKINSMTVESPRDIPLNNPQRRTTDTLRQEGYAMYRTIFEAYGSPSSPSIF